jgi:hypothetical protein
MPHPLPLSITDGEGTALLLEAATLTDMITLPLSMRQQGEGDRV